jgi:hypothetical protein
MLAYADYIADESWSANDEWHTLAPCFALLAVSGSLQARVYTSLSIAKTAKAGVVHRETLPCGTTGTRN